MLEVQKGEGRAASSCDGRTEEEIPVRVSLPPWWQFAIAVTAVVIAVLAIMHGPEWVTQANNFRGRLIAAKAQRLIDEGRREAAISIMVDAFERSPDEPLLVRTLAIAAAEKHPEQAKYLFERLYRLEACTPDDQIRLAKVLSRLNDESGAAARLGKAAADGARKHGFWLARADLGASAGRIGESQEDYKRALNLSPDDIEATIGLGRLLSNSANAAKAAEGVSILLDAMEKSMGEGDRAALGPVTLALSCLPIEPPDLRKRLVQLIAQHPAPTTGLSVLASVMRYPLKPSDRQRSDRTDDIRATMNAHPARGVDEREEAAAILQAHGEHNIVVEWLSAEGTELGSRLCAIRIDSLMALGRWVEAGKMVGRPDSPLSASTKKLLLALIHLRETGGKAPDAKLLLSEAMTAAGEDGRQSMYMAIGQVALEYGINGVAVSAFGAAMEFPFSQHLPLDAYVLSARRADVGAEEVLHALLMRALIDRWNLDLHKHLCYFRLLLGTEIEMVANDVTKLAELLPDDPYFRFLTAFASFRSCDFDGAAAKLAPLPAYRWHQGEASVIAAILTSAGRIDEAEKLLSQINGTGLFAEESRLLSAPRALASIMPGPHLRTVDPGGVRYLDDKR